MSRIPGLLVLSVRGFCVDEVPRMSVTILELSLFHGGYPLSLGGDLLPLLMGNR